MRTAVCIGGPMAGRTVSTRSNIGFVAVDAAGSAAWLYYISPVNGKFLLDTRTDPSSLDDQGTRLLDLGRAQIAAEEENLDVVALPGEGDPEQPAEAPVFDDDSGEGGED